MASGNYEGYKAVSCSRDVYRLDPRPATPSVADDFDRPNGLCFSPDETRLYIVDTGHIRVFDVEGTPGQRAACL